MKCPTHNAAAKVIESLTRENGNTYRRYVCPHGCKFSTTEAMGKPDKQAPPPKAQKPVYVHHACASTPTVNASLGLNVLQRML